MAKALKIRQVKSECQTTQMQRKTLKALGLRGLGSEVYRSDLRAVRGMLNQVQHLIAAEQVNGPVQKSSGDRKRQKGFEIKRK